MKQTTELAVAVPQVMAHRLTRMALAGPNLSARDRKEFELMMAEKQAAFGDACTAMAAQAVRANQALAMSFLQSFVSASMGGRKPSVASTLAQVQKAALAVMIEGVAPVHRKAVANARRLGKTALR